MTFSCVLVTYSYDWSSNPFRDLVHRQTACAAIKHMALGVSGFGCEDALTHLMNYVWPNIFETSPHVVNAVMESIEGMRVALGPSKVLQYCLQVRGYKTLCYAIIFLGFSPSKFLFLTWVESVYNHQSFQLHHVKGYCLFRLTLHLSCHVTLRYMSWLVDSFVMDWNLWKKLFILRFYRYISQGMFHPARKVRDVYWKIYNSLYIGSQVKLSLTFTLTIYPPPS